MSFLYPSYLYGLLLVSIPIIIHFFNFQRARKVYFTNVSFLRTVKEVTNARNKLKNLLVLLARILFIAFLVLAFARPFIPNKQSTIQQSSNYVSVYLDNSYSMQNEQDNRRLFDIALRQAEQLTAIFPSNTLYQLVTNNTTESTPFFYDAARFNERLTEISFNNTDLTWQQVKGLQQQAFEQNGSPRGNHIFWISDFQRYPSETLNANALDTAQNYYLIPLRATQQTNLFVDSVWLESPFIQLQENTTLSIKINNDAEETLTDQVVRLYVDEKQVASTTVTVAGGTSELVELNFAVTESGSKPCRIQLDDYPIVFDNEYYFTLQIAPKIDIVLVTPTNTPYLPQVYRSESFFSLQQFNVNDLDYNALQNADLVILENLDNIDNALRTALTEAMQKGVSLAVFPGLTANVTDYSALLGIPFQQGSGNFQQQAFVGLENPELENPFFEGVFEKMSKNMSMPKGIAAYRWGNIGEPILQFKNNQNFLSIFRRETHNVFLFASPLAPQTTDFFRHALFVPVMYKIALSSKVATDRMAYSFAEGMAAIKVRDFTRNDVVKFQLDALEFIPEQRMVGNELLISLPRSEAIAGNYQMIKRSSEEPIGYIALNYDKAESDLQFFTEEELKDFSEQFPNVQLYENPDEASFTRDFKAQQFAQPLWRYALLLALFFLLVETLLVRFWRTT